MKTAAIIAEYNPFHEGHTYHIKKAREESGCECLVVILSAGFSQRGLPSLITAADKTELALDYGADLVIELPVVYAAQAADEFARYAIESLSSLHIDTLCFGSETADLLRLQRLLSEMEEMEKDPSTSLARSCAAMTEALRPNDILGLQYIRWCVPYGIQPLLIARSEDYKSATQTRADFFAGKTGQFEESHFLKEQNWDSYYPYLRLFLQMSDPEELGEIFLVSEGIQYRLRENASKYRDWNSFLEASISKTYTRARIQRTCLFLMLQITWKQMRENSSFFDVKVLGMNETGRKLLAQVRDEGHIKTRFRDLSPFLQSVHQKTKALYGSVMEQEAPEWKVIVRNA